MEHALPPRPWWRHEATGIARSEGPCTNMLALRTQSREMVCVEGGSRHGSSCLSGRLLQINRKDGCIERCVSVSTFWTGASEGPGSERAGPRLVVTHRLSWVRWSRTLISSWLEGPALSPPSSTGPWLLHARQRQLCSTPRWTERPWTCWEDARQTESVAEQERRWRQQEGALSNEQTEELQPAVGWRQQRTAGAGCVETRTCRPRTWITPPGGGALQAELHGNSTLDWGDLHIPFGHPTVEGGEDGGGTRPVSGRKGNLQDLVTSLCTSGKNETGGGCRRSTCAPRNQSSSLEC